MPFFSYWFWPRPGVWQYSDTRVQVLIGICVALVIASFVISYWRRSLKNPVTKNLSKSWGSAAFWFGVVGLVLVASRVEDIQILEMRALWVLWVACIALYVFFQFLQFRRKHYTVLNKVTVIDERDKYLPSRK